MSKFFTKIYFYESRELFEKDRQLFLKNLLLHK